MKKEEKGRAARANERGEWGWEAEGFAFPPRHSPRDTSYVAGSLVGVFEWGPGEHLERFLAGFKEKISLSASARSPHSRGDGGLPYPASGSIRSFAEGPSREIPRWGGPRPETSSDDAAYRETLWLIGAPPGPARSGRLPGIAAACGQNEGRPFATTWGVV